MLTWVQIIDIARDLDLIISAERNLTRQPLISLGVKVIVSVSPVWPFRLLTMKAFHLQVLVLWYWSNKALDAKH